MLELQTITPAVSTDPAAANALLRAWEKVCRRTPEFLNMETSDDGERIDQALLAYLVRTAAGMSHEQTADFLKIGTIVSLRFCAEIARKQVQWRHRAYINMRIEAIRAQMKAQEEADTKAAREAEQKAQGAVPPVAREVDMRLLGQTTARVCPIFKADPAVVRNQFANRYPREVWARSVILALTRHVLQTEVLQRNLAKAFFIKPNTASVSLRRVRNAVQNLDACVYGEEIRAVCKEFDIEPRALAAL